MKLEELSLRTAGLLLLTATPEQLGIQGHFARLRLLDPERYPSLPQFMAEQQGLCAGCGSGWCAGVGAAAEQRTTGNPAATAAGRSRRQYPERQQRARQIAGNAD